MKNKFLSILLCLALVVSLFSMTALADDAEGILILPAEDIDIIGDPLISENEEELADDNTMLNFCFDVQKGDWYYDDVLYVYINGLMYGTSNVEFSPKKSISRGMITAILYRMEGEPAFMNDNIFPDVAAGSYYEKAIVWANGKGIVEGYDNGNFGPNENITREQLAAMLYRYAQYKGEGFTGDWMFLLDFADANEISSYADEAMHWCVMKGIISGTDKGLLNPKGTATRAEAAKMLHAFAELFAVPEEDIPEEEDVPEYEFIDYARTFANENYDTITFTKGEDCAYNAVIGIYRLAEFEGKADYMDGALEMILTDPNGEEMTATFYPTEEEDVFELIITYTTWPLLETGTVFSGFTFETAAVDD